MIVRFPNLDTLRLALTTGIVPPDVAQKPAVAGFGDDEQVWVETSAKLPAAAQRELKRLGAVVCKSSAATLDMDVSNWLELLPLEREETPLDALEKTPVMFDVVGGEELSRLVLEMLRLGNDRQSYRWLEETGGRAGSRPRPEDRALLRVIGPPYYSLLRALDRVDGAGVAPHAFLERAPGVWVEAGYRHPLAAHIKPPKGKILLLHPPRQWLLLPDAPFRDIYDIVEFQISDSVTHWQDASLPERLTVAPRLRQAGPTEGAELWVLRGDAIDELNRFVQNAEDPLLNRLAFAVGANDGQTLVVLRVRQSKLPPPILMLQAEAYKSYLKLPNLFLPAGCILHPPLRRDVVRKLLAEDVQQVTWLVPGENGQFTPESLPDDVFRPLTDWVDYVLDRDRVILRAWMQEMRFDFEPFVCDEEQTSKPKKPPSGDKTRAPKGAVAPPAAPQESDATTALETTAETTAEDVFSEGFATIEKREPSALQQELHAVEQEFLSLPNGLEDETRRALWPRLADVNARLLHTEDAGICWLHALWAESESDKWSAAWLRTEALAAAQRRANGISERPWLQGRAVSGDDLDRLLAEPEPASSDVRALAAYLCWSARREPRSDMLSSRLPALQRFLEKHEHLLPVRSCWLAWYHLVQWTEGDVLALARARDRLLERLFHNGLRPEQDLPSFLRFAGQSSERRGRGFGQWAMKMHDLARRWLERQRGQNALDYKESKTKDYIDLIFAFALARLGEPDASRQLLQKAQRALGKAEEVHAILFGLFEYRIRQALEGQSTHTPMNAEALVRLNELRQIEEARRANTTSDSGGPTTSPLCYIVDKMRSTSRILEPLQKLHEYRYIAAGHDDEIEQTLAQLPDVKDRIELKERTNWLLRNGKANLGVYVRVLKFTLEQSPRVGEELALQLLQQTLQAYDRSLRLPAGTKDGPSPESLMDLLERGLFVAAHFGQLDAVQELMARFRRLLKDERGASSLDGIDRVVEQGLRGLRKLGLRQEIQELLDLMSDALLQKRDPAKALADKGSGALVRTMLPLAAAWYDCGHEARAEPIYQAARKLLVAKELVPIEHLSLACAYAKAVGATPAAILQARVEELFERLDGVSMTSSYGNYFIPAQVKFVESVVLAVVGDDFTQGTEARRWLDEDEYLVRQRIHADVRNLQAQA